MAEFKDVEDAYNAIIEALTYLEDNKEEPTNQNLCDGGTLLFEGNSAGVYWNFDEEKFYLSKFKDLSAKHRSI